MANERPFEPGAARHGNFINYYQFNPPINRISVLRNSLVEFVENEIPHESVSFLDVGCNTGELTKAVYELVASDGEKRKSIHMLGVDLDSTLIERALDHPKSLHLGDVIEFRSLDVMESRERTESLCGDFLGASTQRKRFDFVLCFSTTMWIHLNHGDSGLEHLLAVLSHWGDNVIIEPQLWKCYRNAARRMKRANMEPFPLFNSLKYRHNILQDIETIICKQLGMVLYKRLGHSEWERPILWFRHSQ